MAAHCVVRKSMLSSLFPIFIGGLFIAFFYIFPNFYHKPNAAISNTMNFQSKIVQKTTGLNILNGTPACVKSGADTCDFRVRIWNHISNTSETSGSGNLMYSQTFQDVEIGSTNGIFNLDINSCGSSTSGNSEWGTSVGTCTVVDDSDSDSDPGVNFDRNDLYIEIGFAPADTTGSLGSFTELFARIPVKSVPSAFVAQTLSGIGSDGFIQLQPSAAQSATGSNPLIWLNESGGSAPDLLNLQTGGSTRFVVDNAGKVGLADYPYFAAFQINNQVTDLSLFENFGTITTSSTGSYPIYNHATITPSAAISGDLTGFYNNLALGDGPGNVTSFIGFDSNLTEASTDTISNIINIMVRNFTSAGGGVNTNQYGLYIENLTSASNDYGIYIAGADTYALFVDSGLTRLDGGIQLSADTDDLISQASSGTGPSANLYYGNRLLCDAMQVNCGWGTGTSLFTDGGTVTYLTSVTDDFAIGATNTLVAPFSVDESVNTVRIGEGSVSNGVLAMYSSDNDTGTITYNTSDQWQFSGGDLVIDQLAAIGTTISTTRKLNVLSTISTATAGQAGYFDINQTSTANTNTITGVYVTARSSSASSLTTAVGVDALANLGSSGAVTNAYAGRFQVTETGTNTITTGAGIRIAASSGTITSNYGIYVEDQTSGTSDYGIYIAGSDTKAIWVDNDDVRFDANLVVGGNTSSTETISNAGFAVDGDDLFVAGMFGVEGAIYTDNGLMIESDINTTGTGDITLSFGGTNTETIIWEDSTDAFQFSDDVLPSTNDSFYLGSDTLRWRELFLGPSSLKVGVSGNQAIIGYNTTNNYITLDPDGDGTAEGTFSDSGELDIDSAIIVGNTANNTAGAIRWNGSNFQGYTGSSWVALDTTSTSANGYLYDKHMQDSSGTNNTVVDQVVRKGWEYGNTSVSYGITYESIPIVVLSVAGISGSNPANLSACTGSGGTYFQYSTVASAISTTGFNITTTLDYDYQHGNPLPGTTLYNGACVTWIAIGEYTSGYGADLAENYLTYDMDLKPGDVVAIDENNNISVRKSNGVGDKNIFGIVSTAPGQTLGNKDGTSEDYGSLASIESKGINKDLIDRGKAKVVPVALEGRVPVKVTLENGPIRKGDYLTAASKPGYAMKATEPGNIIGRALEDFNETTPGLLQSGDSEYDLIINAYRNGEIENLQDLIKYEGNNGEGQIMVLVEKGFFEGDKDRALSVRTTNLEEKSRELIDKISIAQVAVLIIGSVVFLSLVLYIVKQNRNLNYKLRSFEKTNFKTGQVPSKLE